MEDFLVPPPPFLSPPPASWPATVKDRPLPLCASSMEAGCDYRHHKPCHQHSKLQYQSLVRGCRRSCSREIVRRSLLLLRRADGGQRSPPKTRCLGLCCAKFNGRKSTQTRSNGGETYDRRSSGASRTQNQTLEASNHLKWRALPPHPETSSPNPPNPATALTPLHPKPPTLADGASGAEAARGASPGERGGRAMSPGEAAFDGGAGRSPGEPAPHARQSPPQRLRRQGAYPYPQGPVLDQVPMFPYISTVFPRCWGVKAAIRLGFD